MPTLQGKSIIITGAGSGMGAATAKRAFAEGAYVVAADLNKDALDVLAEELGDASRVLVVPTDVTDPEQTEALADAAVATLRYAVRAGQLRRHHAVWGPSSTSTPMPGVESWPSTSTAPSTPAAPWLAGSSTRAPGGHRELLLRRGHPGSGQPHRLRRVQVRSHRHDLHHGARAGPPAIRVNAVAPGMIRTPFTEYMFKDPENAARIDAAHPIGRAGEPHEVASAVVFLLAEEASFVTGADPHRRRGQHHRHRQLLARPSLPRPHGSRQEPA